MTTEITPYNKKEVEKLEAKDLLKRVQKQIGLQNRNPDASMVLEHDGFNYLPISHIEMILDELFFGQWSTSDFNYQQICNEIIGSLTLTITSPVTGQPMTRIGAASIVIMQDKGSKLEDFTTTKKKTALVMGFPRLKAECLKNAAQSIGKLLGRDLNRKKSDFYTPLIPDDEAVNYERKILVALDKYKGADKETFKEMCLEKQKNGEFTVKFAKEILAKIEGK